MNRFSLDTSVSQSDLARARRTVALEEVERQNQVVNRLNVNIFECVRINVIPLLSQLEWRPTVKQLQTAACPAAPRLAPLAHCSH